jgi:hypothetical protein
MRLAVLSIVLSAALAHAYPSYDDGAGHGCVECHDGFQGGNGPLHFQHRTLLGVTTCNLCHPAGGGTTPVHTYWSGPGGGFGCAGCHGQDYGETSPDSGQPKATAYGLRRFHVERGVTACGSAGCHQPGSLGHPDPFPPMLGENAKPPYYDPIFSKLMNPCSSAQEDLPFDADPVGLDNDGDGLVDAADPDCAGTVTTTTTTTASTSTTTLPFGCGPVPAPDCIAPAKALLVVNEKKAGRQKLLVSLSKLETAVLPSRFGDPVAGTTSYDVCVYDGEGRLAAAYAVERAGDVCGSLSCWSTTPGKGYRYTDKAKAADGIQTITLRGGDRGKSRVQVLGTNAAATLPIGTAAALRGQTAATVQLVSSDAACFGTVLSKVTKADGRTFSAVGP